MVVKEFDITTEAPPSVMFDVITDHRNYAKWLSTLRSSELEREGEPAPNGVGAIRVMKLAGPPIREQVIEYEPGERFAYKLLSGAPVRDHTGTLTLTQMPRGGTRVNWRIESTPTIPVISHGFLAIIGKAAKDMLKTFAKEAESREVAPPVTS